MPHDMGDIAAEFLFWFMSDAVSRETRLIISRLLREFLQGDLRAKEFCNPRGKTGSIPWCKPIIRPEEKWRTEILFFPPFFYFSFASQNRPNASITLLTYEYGIGTQNAISYRSFRARTATFFWTDKEILWMRMSTHLARISYCGESNGPRNL
jgi:hypothetical protein